MTDLVGYTDPFISPVTGKINIEAQDLTLGHVWLGDKNDHPVESFKVIDLKIDVLWLKRKLKEIVDPVEGLDTTYFLLGKPFDGIQYKNAQYLTDIPDGLLQHTKEKLEPARLTHGKVWQGNDQNMPVEVDITSTSGAPKDAKYILQQKHSALPNAQALKEIYQPWYLPPFNFENILKINSDGEIEIAVHQSDYIKKFDLDIAKLEVLANLAKWLADNMRWAAMAAASAAAAAASAGVAAVAASIAQSARDKAQEAANQAQQSASSARQSADSAQQSASQAQQSADDADRSAQQAQQSADDAKHWSDESKNWSEISEYWAKEAAKHAFDPDAQLMMDIVWGTLTNLPGHLGGVASPHPKSDFYIQSSFFPHGNKSSLSSLSFLDRWDDGFRWQMTTDVFRGHTFSLIERMDAHDVTLLSYGNESFDYSKPISMGDHFINDLKWPVLKHQATSKEYVDETLTAYFDAQLMMDIVFGTLTNLDGHLDGIVSSKKKADFKVQSSFLPSASAYSEAQISLLNRYDDGVIIKGLFERPDAQTDRKSLFFVKKNGKEEELLFKYDDFNDEFSFEKLVNVPYPQFPFNAASKAYVDQKAGSLPDLVPSPAGTYPFMKGKINQKGLVTEAVRCTPAATTQRGIPVYGDTSGGVLLDTSVTISENGDMASSHGATFEKISILSRGYLELKGYGTLNRFRIQADYLSTPITWTVPQTTSQGYLYNSGDDLLAWKKPSYTEVTGFDDRVNTLIAGAHQIQDFYFDQNILTSDSALHIFSGGDFTQIENIKFSQNRVTSNGDMYIDPQNGSLFLEGMVKIIPETDTVPISNLGCGLFISAHNMQPSITGSGGYLAVGTDGNLYFVNNRGSHYVAGR